MDSPRETYKIAKRSNKLTFRPLKKVQNSNKLKFRALK